mgnify:CR=1 FL=1
MLFRSLSRPDGTTLPFSCDLEPPAARPEHEEPSWKRIARLDSRSYRSKTKTFIGKFKSQNKAFGGASTDGAVPWRHFTVRPGFPKDSPSNLLWLTPKLTRDLATIVKQKTAHLPVGAQAYMHLGDGRFKRPIQSFVSHTWGGAAAPLLSSVGTGSLPSSADTLAGTGSAAGPLPGRCGGETTRMALFKPFEIGRAHV